MFKSQKGITLIALVITIIVLIILAVITINLAFDDNGLFGTAKSARQYQLNAEEYDRQYSANTAKYVEEMVANVTAGN